VTHSGQSGERLQRLLAGAVAVWGLEDRVALSPGAGGAATLRSADGVEVDVEAVRGTQQRWRVRVVRPAREGRPGGERVTEHAGVPGLLRTVRAALAPRQRAGRMIVAPTPGPE